jgi:hypothetical protein
MKLFRILLLPLLIAGCGKNESQPQPPTASQTHKCNLEQLKQVDIYFNICNKSSYFSTYCFERGVESFCTLDEVKK